MIDLLIAGRSGAGKHSLFIVEKGMPGFSLGQRIKDKCGMRASPTAELVFENVLVSGVERGVLVAWCTAVLLLLLRLLCTCLKSRLCMFALTAVCTPLCVRAMSLALLCTSWLPVRVCW